MPFPFSIFMFTYAVWMGSFAAVSKQEGAEK